MWRRRGSVEGEGFVAEIARFMILPAALRGAVPEPDADRDLDAASRSARVPLQFIGGCGRVRLQQNDGRDLLTEHVGDAE